MSALLNLDDSCSDSEEDLDYVPPTTVSDTSEDDEGVCSDEDLEFIKKNGAGKKAQKVSKIETSKESVETKSVNEKEKVNNIWSSFLEEVSDAKIETPQSSPPAVNYAANNCDKEENGTSSPSWSNGSVSFLSPENLPKKSGLELHQNGVSAVMSKENGTSSPSLSNGSVSSLSPENSPKKSGLELHQNGASEVMSKEENGYVKSSENFPKSFSLPSVSSKANGYETVKNGSIKRKGVGSVLNMIMSKKQKTSTLEKTKTDWMSFKKDEGIEEELHMFNKGKGGFIERQRFLQRSDFKRYEVEKSMRKPKMNKAQN